MGAAELGEDLFHDARDRVEEEGVSLLDVEVVPGPRTVVRFVIDADGGVTIDDCVRVTPKVSAFLEEWNRISGRYTVEVTSPGLERKLRRRGEYDHFRGREVRLHADLEGEGAREYRGVLEGMEGDFVLLETAEETLRFPIDRIRKARLYFRGPKRSDSERKK